MLREGLLPYWWMLYRHSKILNQPTDIFRNVEDSFTVKHADGFLKPESVYLDIGSGSSLVPTFLYNRFRPTTYVTEVDPVYLDRQRSYVATLGLTDRDWFYSKLEDATKLSFAGNSVDFITAISTIEHIPQDGDMKAMAEFARVLRPGGRLVVTVPAGGNYEEVEASFYYPGFERRYDSPALDRRLLSLPGLQLIDELYMTGPTPELQTEFQQQFGEVLEGQGVFEVWYKNKYAVDYADISILLSLGFVGLSKQRQGMGGALLVLEKK